MNGTVHNKDKFLQNIASRLGRERIKQPVKRPEWAFRPQDEVLKDVSLDGLVEVLKDQCLRIHTSLFLTELDGLSAKLKEVVETFGGGPIVAWKDQRFSQWGLDSLFNDELHVSQWNPAVGRENVAKAEEANIGITISEITLAESGTVVHFSDENKGRTVSFLPASYIAIVPKSSIVPRMTQAAQRMRELHNQTGRVPSCINFITGPSNSADIELNLVVGVHGPVKAAYIVVNDI